MNNIVSKSDILGPNANLSDIKILVLFEREMFKDSSYSYRITKFLLFMSISILWKTCLNIINGVHVNYIAI